MDEKEILVSIGDRNVKEIGEAIGNKTCNKILELLADSEMSATDLSKKMKVSLTTVDYAIKKLLKTGLISKSGHWWSVKGKKISMYKVSNKKIIISPRKSLGKIFGTVILLTGLVGLTIKQFFKNRLQFYNVPNFAAWQESAFIASDNAELLGETAALTKATGEVASVGFFQSLSPWSWFLIGAWLAILLFFILTLISERRSKK